MSRRRLLIASGLFALLCACAALWLVGTASGLRFVLARAQASWPEGRLQFDGVRGRLVGPLQLDVLSLEAGGRPIVVRDIALEWRPLAVLAGTAQVQRLGIGTVAIGAAADGEPAESAPFDPDALVWQWPQIDLPVAVSLDQLQLGVVTLEDAPLLHAAEAALQLSRRGELTLSGLRIDSPEGELQLAGRLPAARDGEGLRGTLRRAGTELALALAAGPDGARLDVEAVDRGASVTATLQPPFAWTLQAKAEQADLRALVEALPASLVLDLQASGDNHHAQLVLVHDGALAPLLGAEANVHWQDAPRALSLQSLELRPAGGGRVSGEATLQLDDAAALTATLRAEDAAFQQDEPDAPAPRLNATFQLDGPLDALRVEGEGAVHRADLELPLKLAGTVGEQDFTLEQLQLDGVAGRLDASGRIAWAPAVDVDLGLQLARFDPAWLDKRLRGSLSGGGQLQVVTVDEGMQVRLALEQLSGDWLGSPLAANGELHWRGERLDGAVDLDVGRGHLRVRAAEGGPLRVEFAPLQLAALWPGLAGELRGDVQVRQPFAPWDVQLALTGHGLAMDGYHIDLLKLEGGVAELEDRKLDIAIDGLVLAADMEPHNVRIGVRGRPAQHAVSLNAEGRLGRLDAEIQGSEDGGVRRLRIDRLKLDGRRYGTWQLTESGTMTIAPQLVVPRHCLADEVSSICASVQDEAGVQRLVWDVDRMRLSRLLALAGVRRTLRADGELSLRGDVQLAPVLRPGSVALRLSPGALHEQNAETPYVLMGWEGGGLDAQLDGGMLRGKLSLLLSDDGHVDGDFQLPWGDAPQWEQLEGVLRVDVAQLQALSALAPDVVNARGAVRGELRWLPGALDNPQGAIGLQGFAATVPAIGLTVGNGELSLRQQDGQLQVEGFLDTGEGPLRIEGAVQRGEQLGARFRIAGQGVRLADAPRLKLVASPELDVRWQKGTLRVRGEVVVPSAHVDLERLEAGIQDSPDVVVVDPKRPATGVAALPIDADVQVRLGEQVTLAGFGFDGGVSGDLRITEKQGQPTRGRGSLDLRGSYKAYGQDLSIERGRLLFASSAIDNPGIDLRAKRSLREVEVGVEVRGSARRPRLSVWSNPALEQAEALSWLVLGRPLRSATAADGAQLGQAAAAMGGNLLAAKVGGRLGFDTFGVADSTALGGAAFTVGKYLSPRLYLSYGVALFDSGRVVTLRYLITDRLDAEIEAANESRAGINYRIERD